MTEVSGEIVPVEDAAASELAELRAEVAALKAQLDEDGGDDDARHKFTAERGDGIIALITGGVGKERACRTMGITGRTLRRWRQYARAGQEPFVEYVERLEQAEATVMGFGAQSIFKAGQTKLRKPFCRHCETAVTTVTCQDCEAEVELRCDACNRKLVVEVPGDWRAMDRWLAKTFPNEWGDRINVDVQGQLRAFLLACRDEFEAEPEVFFRLMDVARRGAGPGVVPGDRGR